MIRVKSILGKMFLLNISEQQLFSASLKDVPLSKTVCPICGAIGCCVSHASYERDMITMKDGLRCNSSVSIPRVLCTSCGHTHALIPDVLIPFGSYSLCFILSALQRYLNRCSTVAALCDSLQISISTLYGWIHLFEQHASLWLGVLHQVAKLNPDALQEIYMLDSFPSAFFSRYHFSFLQFYKTSRFDTPIDSS